MLYERRYLSPPPPPKISLKHDHNWTKGNDQSGSTVEQQPVVKLVQQSFGEAPRAEFSKPTQSKPNPICDRSGKPEDTERVFVEKGKTSRSQEIDGKRLQEDLDSSETRGNLRSLKTFASCMLTMEQGNLWHQVQVHTQWKNLVLPNIVALHHQTRITSSTVQSTRRTLTWTSQVCRIRWWNDHMA